MPCYVTRRLHDNNLFCINSWNVVTGDEVIWKFAVCSAGNKWMSEINFRPFAAKVCDKLRFCRFLIRWGKKDSASLPFTGGLTVPSQAWHCPFLANQLLASLSTLIQLSSRREVDLDLRSHSSSSQHCRHYPSLPLSPSLPWLQPTKNNIFINSLIYSPD